MLEFIVYAVIIIAIGGAISAVVDYKTKYATYESLK